jgi:16S rRNA (uracil1498-N3)-methyltransferase
MEENRFYHSENLELKHVVELGAQTHIHATKVLRLKVGDQFALFNGDGFDYPNIKPLLRLSIGMK